MTLVLIILGILIASFFFVAVLVGKQAGFDLIVGHHPHVIQPIELIDRTFVLYSLGNFFGRMVRWPAKLAGILEIDLDESGTIARYALHPYMLLEETDPPRLTHYQTTRDSLKNKIQKKLNLLFDC